MADIDVDAGRDQSAVVGQVIQLDASRASDAEGDELAFDWALVRRPQGSGAKILTPAEDRPSLTVDVPGRGLDIGGDVPEQREAIEAWADHMKSLVWPDGVEALHG